MLPRIGITPGDLAGIGPEVIYKTLQDNRMLRFCTPVVYGTATTLFDDFPHDKQHGPLAYRQVREAADVVADKINAVTCWGEEDFVLTPGQPSEASGRAARLSLLAAAADLKAGRLDGIVTAPISKENTQGEGFNFPGHTEFMAHHFSTNNDSLMLLVSDDLRVATATGHIALKDVPARLTRDVLASKLRMLLHSLRQDFGIQRPRVAVLGLNPHAGENGLIGHEERDLLQPLIQQFLHDGHLVYGPYPADGYFGTRQYQQFDATLALYHDQGLIPFKTIAFERGVNFTAGLPVVRTSPDHGTAYGLAGKFAADPTSFREALYLACDLIRNRTSV